MKNKLVLTFFFNNKMVIIFVVFNYIKQHLNNIIKIIRKINIQLNLLFFKTKYVCKIIVLFMFLLKNILQTLIIYSHNMIYK